MTAILLSLITFVSTSLGGLFALRHRRRLDLVMAFSAGVLVAAAFLDLLPDAFDVVKASPGASENDVLVATTLGFLVFYGLERFVHLQAAGHGPAHDHDHELELEHAARARIGSAAALGLTIHSFLDGFAIGVAYRANPALGLLVAVAVIAHDFADGVSTVAVVIGARGPRASLAWLAADAIAPVVGAAAGTFIAFRPSYLAEVIGFFAGTFLFIGASHLLPESHEGSKSPLLSVAVVAGFAFLYLATQVLSR